jgi:hypothetical protein
VGSAQEAPHPPRSPSRSSSRLLPPGAHATTYFSSTSPWATSTARETSTSAKQAAALERHRSSVDLDLGKQVAALGGTLDL